MICCRLIGSNTRSTGSRLLKMSVMAKAKLASIRVPHVSRGATADVCDRWGMTPLHLVASWPVPVARDEPDDTALGSGGGGGGGGAKTESVAVACVSALLAAEGVYYGLVRTTETIDASVTVKFVFVSFIGESVAPMRKAKISTLKGTIAVAFEHIHSREYVYRDLKPENIVIAADGYLKLCAGDRKEIARRSCGDRDESRDHSSERVLEMCVLGRTRRRE